MSALKKSGLKFRTLDPREISRLSLHDAIKQVHSSLGVLAHLVSPARTGAAVSNGRAAVLCGMAMAAGKNVLMLQEGDTQQPIDYRDVVQSYSDPNKVSSLIVPFIKCLVDALQPTRFVPTLLPLTMLEKTTPLASGPCRWPRWSSPRRPASSTGTRWTPVSPCPGSPPAGTARDLLLPAPVGESRRSGRVPRCCFAEPAILPSPRRPPFASSASRSRLLPASVPETTRSRCTRGRSPGSSPDEPQRARHLDFAGLAFRHHGERRQVAIVVQQQVQLDGALRLLVLRPVEHAHRQVDDAAVQTHQLVLETELLSPALAAHQFLALEQRLFEPRLVQPPRLMLIGVGQRDLLGATGTPKCFN